MIKSNLNCCIDDEATDCILVDPANEFLSVMDEAQLSVSEEESSAITQDLGDPLHSSSFVEENSLHSSSLTEESLSQSLSLTEDLSRSVGDYTTVQPGHN